MQTNRLFGRVYRAEEGDVPSEAAPVVPDNPAPASDDSDSGVNEWSELVADDVEEGGQDFDSAGEPEATPPVEAPAVTPAAPVPAPAVPAEPVAPVPAAPVPPAVEPTPVVPVVPEVPPAETPAAPAVDPVEARNGYLASLRQYYALSPENAQRLQTEPELVLPELAATLHLEVVDAIMNMLPQHVGSIVEHHTRVTQANKEAEDSFFKAWPELVGHKDAVLRVGQMYRAANPKATKDQAIGVIGKFVMDSLGIVRTAPSAPSNPAPTPAQVNPFVPAAGSASGQPPATPGEWDFILDDDS